MREKNAHMRKGRVEQANALALRIGSEFIAFNYGPLKEETKSVGTRDFWSAVRDITGKRRSTTTFSCVDADSLNAHYAKVSTDRSYLQPPLKHTCCCPTDWPSEMLVFEQLDKLKPTAAGPDLLPSWFLKLAAPSIARPLAHLYNLSFIQSTLPSQWKTAAITPIPKIPLPSSCSDFRPISLTPILCSHGTTLAQIVHLPCPVLSHQSDQLRHQRSVCLQTVRLNLRRLDIHSAISLRCAWVSPLCSRDLVWLQ